jgi:glyoxylase-like metal-dependent hydrolase (beta-lactamase superfamily II)
VGRHGATALAREGFRWTTGAKPWYALPGNAATPIPSPTVIRTLLKLLAGLVLLLVVALAIALGWAHLAIRNERAPLPDPAAIAAAPASDDRPTRLTWINTATQPMPRSEVLDPDGDPRAAERYVMSHPSFVLEWVDGRILLVDAGMPRDEAIRFGAPLEWAAHAEPIAPIGSVREQLGDAAERVRGVVFTHLHTDHVAGVRELCSLRTDRIAVPTTAAQAERSNYTTRPGSRIIAETECLELKRLGPDTVQPIPGFPGVAVIAAGGHTPGSQIVLAEVGAEGATRRYAFVGDIVNNIDGIRLDRGKPFFYRTFLVPEDETRLGELRRMLATLERTHGYVLLVAHDQLAIESSGVPPFPG